jgi:hypothetical protein
VFLPGYVGFEDVWRDDLNRCHHEQRGEGAVGACLGSGGGFEKLNEDVADPLSNLIYLMMKRTLLESSKSKVGAGMFVLAQAVQMSETPNLVTDFDPRIAILTYWYVIITHVGAMASGKGEEKTKESAI